MQDEEQRVEQPDERATSATELVETDEPEVEAHRFEELEGAER